jgi:micrococcal nuclease
MYTYNCTIVRVVDGDTVDVNIDLGFDVILRNQRVRLHGVDAPNIRTRDPIEKHFGQLSAMFIESLLPIGEKFTFVSREYNATGKFGRLLGDFEVVDPVTNNYTFLTLLLVSSGHGVVYNMGAAEVTRQLHLNNRRMLIENNTVTGITLAEAGLE